MPVPAPTQKGPLSVLFGERLNAILESRGLTTYEQKGRALGVSRQEAYKVLRAQHSPSLDKVKTIADSLGIDPAELLTMPAAQLVNQ